MISCMDKIRIENYALSLVKHGFYKSLFWARRESKRWHRKEAKGFVEPLKCPHRPDIEVIVEEGKVTYILK